MARSVILDRELNPLLRVFRNGFRGELLATLKGQLGAEFQERLEETLVTEQYYHVSSGRAATTWPATTRCAWGNGCGGRTCPPGCGRGGPATRPSTARTCARPLHLKLADLAYLSGDLETERCLREHYYGALTE
jgi:hypothetical protein